MFRFLFSLTILTATLQTFINTVGNWSIQSSPDDQIYLLDELSGTTSWYEINKNLMSIYLYGRKHHSEEDRCVKITIIFPIDIATKADEADIHLFDTFVYATVKEQHSRYYKALGWLNGVQKVKSQLFSLNRITIVNQYGQLRIELDENKQHLFEFLRICQYLLYVIQIAIFYSLYYVGKVKDYCLSIICRHYYSFNMVYIYILCSLYFWNSQWYFLDSPFLKSITLCLISTVIMLFSYIEPHQFFNCLIDLVLIILAFYYEIKISQYLIIASLVTRNFIQIFRDNIINHSKQQKLSIGCVVLSALGFLLLSIFYLGRFEYLRYFCTDNNYFQFIITIGGIAILIILMFTECILLENEQRVNGKKQ